MSSRWPDKYIIGLTGNIGTGKSVVRKMLEHLGAFGIDADELSHRAIYKGSPGYRAVVTTFGTWLLREDGEIDRPRLGRVVFSDPVGLRMLEAIIHPLVDQAIDVLIKHTKHKVVVIESIKLNEQGLAKVSDSVWVATVPEAVQIQRLVERRGMPKADAQQRIKAQSAQQKKIATANVVIQNGGSITDTWHEVNTAWNRIFPDQAQQTTSQKKQGTTTLSRGKITTRRGHPQDAGSIAEFLNKYGNYQTNITSNDVIMNLGERAYLIFECESRIAAIVGLQVENLVARTIDLVIEPEMQLSRVLPDIINEIEKASRDLQCEVSLVFAPPRLMGLSMVWKSLGYQPTKPADLEVLAWQEAAEESKPAYQTALLYKRLRSSRVLRPI